MLFNSKSGASGNISTWPITGRRLAGRSPFAVSPDCADALVMALKARALTSTVTAINTLGLINIPSFTSVSLLLIRPRIRHKQIVNVKWSQLPRDILVVNPEFLCERLHLDVFLSIGEYGRLFGGFLLHAELGVDI